MSPTMPTKGKCSACKSDDLEFYEDGDGLCLECGRIFWWDKSKAPVEEGAPVVEAPEPSPEQPVAPPQPVQQQQPAVAQQPAPQEQQYAQTPAAAPAAAPYYPPQDQLGQYPPQQPMHQQPVYDQQQYPAQPEETYGQQPGIHQQAPGDVDPVTMKAWKKMEKRFKGGGGAGAIGAIGAGMIYVVLPLSIYYMLLYLFGTMIDGFNIADLPNKFEEFLESLLMIPIYIGWLMIALGFAKKYFRRGSPHRAGAGVAFQGAKFGFLYFLLSPFVIDFEVIAIDYSGYINIVYLLIAITAAYLVLEYFAYKNDLAAYHRGEIPDEYYPKEYRKGSNQAVVPPQPVEQPIEQYAPPPVVPPVVPLVEPPVAPPPTAPPQDGPQKPSGGKCSQCKGHNISFYDNGSGMCNDCQHTFWWDKSIMPPQEPAAPVQEAPVETTDPVTEEPPVEDVQEEPLDEEPEQVPEEPEDDEPSEETEPEAEEKEELDSNELLDDLLG